MAVEEMGLVRAVLAVNSKERRESPKRVTMVEAETEEGSRSGLVMSRKKRRPVRSVQREL